MIFAARHKSRMFYALQQPEVTNKIMKHGSGKDSLIFSLEIIRDIDLPLPTPEREQEITAKHEKILKKNGKSRKPKTG